MMMMTEKLLDKLSMILLISLTLFGKTFQKKLKILSKVRKCNEFLETLRKDRRKRISLKEVLEHPWITKSDKNLRELRRKSADGTDKFLEFMAFTTTNAEKVEQQSLN